jgi:hypothetical protein
MTSSLANGHAVEKPTPTEFIDFYALLGQPRDAETVQLRSRLNELYADAQANRDHRNPERRKHYARLLQWIPTARGVLLHEERRARYDEYSQRRTSGVPETDFHEFLQNLLGENEFSFADGESIPAIRQAPEAPRLLSSLDAVREATQQSVAANGTSLTPAVSPARETHDTITTAQVQTSQISEPIQAPPRAAKSRRSSAPLHPSVLRERALLLSSAWGGIAFFVILLGLRVLLGTASSLALIVVVAAVAGFVAWRVSNRAMLAKIEQ